MSAKGAINTVEHNARAATSPISDKSTLPVFGSPVNEKYRGMTTVAAKLQQRLSGKGMPHAKTRARLLPWIDQRYKGYPSDWPRLYRATFQKTDAQRINDIVADAAGCAPMHLTDGSEPEAHNVLESTPLRPCYTVQVYRNIQPYPKRP